MTITANQPKLNTQLEYVQNHGQHLTKHARKWANRAVRDATCEGSPMTGTELQWLIQAAESLDVAHRAHSALTDAKIDDAYPALQVETAARQEFTRIATLLGLDRDHAVA